MQNKSCFCCCKVKCNAEVKVKNDIHGKIRFLCNLKTWN